MKADTFGPWDESWSLRVGSDFMFIAFKRSCSKPGDMLISSVANVLALITVLTFLDAFVRFIFWRLYPAVTFSFLLALSNTYADDAEDRWAAISFLNLLCCFEIFLAAIMFPDDMPSVALEFLAMLLCWLLLLLTG